MWLSKVVWPRGEVDKRSITIRYGQNLFLSFLKKKKEKNVKKKIITREPLVRVSTRQAGLGGLARPLASIETVDSLFEST